MDSVKTMPVLGIITPPTNTTNEVEWKRLLPPGIELRVARMALHADTHSAAGALALRTDLEAAMHTLGRQGAHVLAYACTAGSMVSPPDDLPGWMEQLSGRPAVTTAWAIIRALRALGIRRLSVATPYHDALNRHETHFLESEGFTVLSCAGLGIGQNGPHDFVRIAQVPHDRIEAHVRSTRHPDAEAMLISCTDYPTLALIPKLESEWGIPVLSSNTATLWAMLKAARYPLRLPAGRLFRA